MCGAACYNVRVHSHRSSAPRRIPQQKRGKRRVSGFLRAAAAVIAEVGYERATMSSIAARADSCIGSLYQFFPNKLAVVEALRGQYVSDSEASWAALARAAATLRAESLASRLVGMHVEIAKSHPALLALLDVPPTSHTRMLRELVRNRIATVLIAHKRRIPEVAALRIASVVQQITKALLTLYAQADPDEKAHVIREFKTVLTAYLVPKLKIRTSRDQVRRIGGSRRIARASAGLDVRSAA